MIKLIKNLLEYFSKEEKKIENKVMTTTHNLFTKYPHWDSEQAPYYE